MGMGRTQQGGTDHSLLVARYGPNQIDRRHQVAGKHPDPGGGQPDIYTDNPDTTAENRSQRHTRRTSVAVRRTVEHELQRRTRDHRHAGRTAKTHESHDPALHRHPQQFPMVSGGVRGQMAGMQCQKRPLVQRRRLFLRKNPLGSAQPACRTDQRLVGRLAGRNMDTGIEHVQRTGAQRNVDQKPEE